MPFLTVSFEGESKKTLSLPFEGTPLIAEVLLSRGIVRPHPCGGRGICGKCAIKAEGKLSEPDEHEKKAGTRLSCRTRLWGDARITLPKEEEGLQSEGDAHARSEGVSHGVLMAAADIGTTTVAVHLTDENENIIASHVTLNPQTVVAADVIGRIGAAMKEGPTLQQELILHCLDDLLSQCAAQAKRKKEEISRAVFTGNTAMLYLLTGRDPASLSQAPFRADCLFDLEETVLGIPSYLPPCFHAFAGADLMCAVLESGMTEKAGTSLLGDIGTNGEIALWRNGQLYVTSTAAGPAFEGAGISCGMHSVNGAIDSVTLMGNRLLCRVIGGGEARGLCGSGLIDAVSALLETGGIDETGYMEEESIALTGGVSLLRADIRAVQLAKAAIYAGILSLLKAAHCQMDDVETLYLAGGFGSRLHIPSAVRIGLIPEAVAGRVKVLGNAALSGADRMLREEARQAARGILANSIRVDLGGDPLFNELYIESMLFSSQEE